MNNNIGPIEPTLVTELKANIVELKKQLGDDVCKQDLSELTISRLEENDRLARAIIREAGNRLSAALASIAELQKDKSRLDWLETQQGITTCGFRFKWFYDEARSLRQAIDAAMNPK